VIIWSHAGGRSHRDYVGLSSHWAGYGYVVIRPSHGDTAEDEPVAPDWRNRVRDITFVLDSLDTLEQRYPELQGRIDRTRVGAGGHARGATTALLLGGLRLAGSATSYADPRIKAVVAMSPPGPSEAIGITRESYAGINVPTLFMTGTLDKGLTEDETPEWRRIAFDAAPPGDKWLVVIPGARTTSFTGRLDAFVDQQSRAGAEPPMMDPRADPRVAEQQRNRNNATRAQAVGERERSLFSTAKSFSLAFWDAYLRGDSAGREHLEKAMTWTTIEVKKK
jgi:predicted dienelactone hydrolase